MTKKDLRQRIGKLRRSLSDTEISVYTEQILDKVVKSPEYMNANEIFVYVNYKQEVPTLPLIRHALEKGKKVAVPRVEGDIMEFYYISEEEDLEPGYMGIWEPVIANEAEAKNALMIMPALAFDSNFYRLGYGGGYYDRYINEHPGSNFIKMGLAYNFQYMRHNYIDAEWYDRQVDVIVTPDKLYRRSETESGKNGKKNKNILDDVDLFVLDMDGTFYLSEDIIPGSNEFLKMVTDSGRKWMFFTNNSSKDKSLYIEKLARMDCKITPDDILTSGDIMIEFLKTERSGKSVYVMGTPALERSFKEAGIDIRQDINEKADIVVVAFDMTLTYEKLEHACTLIRNGAEYLATHPDINCPVSGGFIPDCGAFIAAINLSTGKTPRITGKPYPETPKMISSVTGIPLERIAFVGDRLYTDVACGVKNGAKGILVLSGETKLDDVDSSDVKPDMIFDRIYDIGKALKAKGGFQ